MSGLAQWDPIGRLGRSGISGATGAGAGHRRHVANARFDDPASDFSRRIQADLAKLPPECRERPRWRLAGISGDARAERNCHDQAADAAPEPPAQDEKAVCEDLASLSRCWAVLTPARRKQVLGMVRAWARAEGDQSSG